VAPTKPEEVRAAGGIGREGDSFARRAISLSIRASAHTDVYRRRPTAVIWAIFDGGNLHMDISDKSNAWSAMEPASYRFRPPYCAVSQAS